MSYSNRVNLHGYCNSFIHYFSIYFSLFSTFSGSQLFLSTMCSLLTLTSLSFHLSLSPPISPQAHRSHSHRSHSLPIQPQQANNAMAELRNTVAEFRWYDLTRTRPRNDTVVELLGTWCVGFDGYWFVGIDRVDGGWDFDGWVEYFIRWVLILIGLFFLDHWWVLMILLPIGWVMIWLDWVWGWVSD